MNKVVSLSLAALVIVLLGASILFWQKFRQMEASYASVKATQDATQLRYGDALSAIAEIQDSLSTLGVSEATRPVLPGSPSTDRGLSVLRGREALDRIALLKAGIERTKLRLRDLENRARLSGVKIAGLERVIQGLRRTIVQKEELVAALTNRVDSLSTAVVGLTGEITTANEAVRLREQTIDEQRRELGTVYYVVGDKRGLTRSGAARTMGGFLGFGQTLVPTGTLIDSVFTPMDTDAQTVIPIDAARARVLSAQPQASYSLVQAGKGLELHILDAHAFRTVRQVVILRQS